MPERGVDGVRAVLLDAGDTLVDEGSQTWDGDVVLTAELIPGAIELVHELRRRRLPLALVADGPRATFENVLGAAGLLGCFEAMAISDELGVEKPDPLMFETALGALGVDGADYSGVLMVGNNLRRDIAGANVLGLTTVWIDWAPRRRKVPRTDLEVPDHTITAPIGLLGVLDLLQANAST